MFRRKKKEIKKEEIKKEDAPNYWNEIYCHLQPVKCYARDVKLKFGYSIINYYNIDYEGDETYVYYRKIKNILNEIDDGWLEIDSKQTYYNFDDREVNESNEEYEFTELETGDLVVWRTVKEKKLNIETEYTHTERYKPGKWGKIVTTSPSKVSLIPDGYENWVERAKILCKIYENNENHEEGIVTLDEGQTITGSKTFNFKVKV